MVSIIYPSRFFNEMERNGEKQEKKGSDINYELANKQSNVRDLAKIML